MVRVMDWAAILFILVVSGLLAVGLTPHRFRL